MNARRSRDIIDAAAPARRRSRQARVVWGDRVVTVGGDAPVRVQSMTNTDTVDVIGTAIQVKELARGRLASWCASPSTRPRPPQAVPHIREQLDRMGIDVPLIGDFHYNGHRLLTDYPGHGAGAVASTASTPATSARATSATASSRR